MTNHSRLCNATTATLGVALLLLMAPTAIRAGTCAKGDKMKAVKLTAFDPNDPLSNLQVVEEPIPSPAEGQVLIRMSAMPIHPADYFSIMGVYPGFQPESLPATPGLEGCGVVAAFGPNTHQFLQNGRFVKVGSRVIPLRLIDINIKGGSWAEYVIANVEDVVVVPGDIPDESCAQILNPMTVVGMLDELDAPRGKYVLQSAGGSALGKKLIQIAKERGLKTISTVRRCEQVDELKALGADEVICTSDGSDVADAVMDITDGEGVWGAVDAVVGDMTAEFQDATRPGGTVIVFGGLTGLDFRGSVASSIFRDVTIKGFWLVNSLPQDDPIKRKKLMGEALKSLEMEENLITTVGKKYLIDDVVEAVVEANRDGRSSDGKAMLVTDPGCAKDFTKEEL